MQIFAARGRSADATDRGRDLQDDVGNKRQIVEIQVAHVGPDLQFATATVTKARAGDSPAPAEQAG